jgi:AcrR family transcriptional regulator
VNNKVVPLGHEAGKARRRRRIIDAAIALVREGASNALSMEQIASRAEVSRATLYNLFDTKAAIFRVAYDEEIALFTQVVIAVNVKSAFDRIFYAIELWTSRCRRDPDYYRATIHMTALEPIAAEANSAHRAFWQDLLKRAVDAGEMQVETDTEFVGGLLMQIMRGMLLDWTLGALSTRRLSEDVTYAFCLVLRDCATEAATARVSARMRSLQSSRRKMQKKPPGRSSRRASRD